MALEGGVQGGIVRLEQEKTFSRTLHPTRASLTHSPSIHCVLYSLSKHCVSSMLGTGDVKMKDLDLVLKNLSVRGEAHT